MNGFIVSLGWLLLAGARGLSIESPVVHTVDIATNTFSVDHQLNLNVDSKTDENHGTNPLTLGFQHLCRSQRSAPFTKVQDGGSDFYLKFLGTVKAFAGSSSSLGSSGSFGSSDSSKQNISALLPESSLTPKARERLLNSGRGPAIIPASCIDIFQVMASLDSTTKTRHQLAISFSEGNALRPTPKYISWQTPEKQTVAYDHYNHIFVGGGNGGDFGTAFNSSKLTVTIKSRDALKAGGNLDLKPTTSKHHAKTTQTFENLDYKIIPIPAFEESVETPLGYLNKVTHHLESGAEDHDELLIKTFGQSPAQIYVGHSGPLPMFRKVFKRFQLGFWTSTVKIEEYYDAKNNAAGFEEEYDGSTMHFMMNRVIGQRRMVSPFTSDANKFPFIQEFLTVLPQEVTGFEYYDRIGNVSTSVFKRERGNGHITLNLEPRFPIIGQWGNDWWLSFHASEKHFKDEKMSSLMHSTWRIPTAPAIRGVFVEEMEIEIVLPPGTVGTPTVEIAKEYQKLAKIDTSKTTKRWMDMFTSRKVVSIKLGAHGIQGVNNPALSETSHALKTFAPGTTTKEESFITISYSRSADVWARLCHMIYAPSLCAIFVAILCSPSILSWACRFIDILMTEKKYH